MYSAEITLMPPYRRTMYVPTIDAGIENAARSSGSMTASWLPKSAPRNIDATTVTA